MYQLWADPSLDQSMKNFKGEIEQKVLDSMRTTAEGIQLCDVNINLRSGLSNLSDSLKKTWRHSGIA